MKFGEFINNGRESIPVHGARRHIINRIENKTRLGIISRLNSILDNATAASINAGYDGRFKDHRNWRGAISELIGYIPEIYKIIEASARKMSAKDGDNIDFADLDDSIIKELEIKIQNTFDAIDNKITL